MTEVKDEEYPCSWCGQKGRDWMVMAGLVPKEELICGPCKVKFGEGLRELGLNEALARSIPPGKL